jgi:hypothetical protein
MKCMTRNSQSCLYRRLNGRNVQARFRFPIEAVISVFAVTCKPSVGFTQLLVHLMEAVERQVKRATVHLSRSASGI